MNIRVVSCNIFKPESLNQTVYLLTLIHWSQQHHFFFNYKMEVFSCQNNPKNLDPVVMEQIYIFGLVLEQKNSSDLEFHKPY